MVLLKIHLRGDIREKFDFTQANTARSRQLKCLQIQNWLTLGGVRLKQIFQIFEYLYFQGI